MGTYSLAEAKDQLSRLVDEALSGEIVTITRHGKPVVSLTPTVPAPLPLTKADIEQMRRRRDAPEPWGPTPWLWFAKCAMKSLELLPRYERDLISYILRRRALAGG